MQTLVLLVVQANQRLCRDIFKDKSPRDQNSTDGKQLAKLSENQAHWRSVGERESEHASYRNWCENCVIAKGQGKPHPATSEYPS